MARLPVHQSFGESAQHVRLLHERIFDLADSTGAPADDARRVNLHNSLRATSAAESSLRLMEWSRLGGAEVLINGLGLVAPFGFLHFSEDLLRATKHFLVLEYQFQTEALMRNLLLALGLQVPAGFFQVVTRTLTVLELGDIPERRERVYLAAHLRNSMHANGVHHGYQGSDTVLQVGDLEFRFEHGKRVSCGHWEHVCAAILTSLNEVSAILSSEQVRALEFVPERYTQLLSDAS